MDISKIFVITRPQCLNVIHKRRLNHIVIIVVLVVITQRITDVDGRSQLAKTVDVGLKTSFIYLNF